MTVGGVAIKGERERSLESDQREWEWCSGRENEWRKTTEVRDEKIKSVRKWMLLFLKKNTKDQCNIGFKNAIVLC